MKIRLMLLMVGMFLLMGCSGPASEPDSGIHPVNIVEVGVPFTLSVGQEGFLEGAGTIRMISIDEDSRCPVDVACVWEGQVTASFLWIAVGETSYTSFTLSSSTAQSAAVAGYQIELVGVEPPIGKSGVEIASANYQLTVQINQ